MKIGFTTDTNILKKKDDQLIKSETVLDGIDFYIEYINALKKTKEEKELIYLLPEVVIDELLSQKKSLYDKSYNSLIESYSKLQYGLEGVIPNNIIEKKLKKEKKNYVKKLNIIKLPLKKDIFQKIIDDSIEKKAPFDKSFEGKKTDAGFKDSIIWNTILYNGCIDNFDYFYFFTGDKVFEENKQYLIDEFNKKHPNTKLIIHYEKPDGQQRQKSLRIIIDEQSLAENETIMLYDEYLILNSLKTLKYNNKTIYSYLDKYEIENILFEQFDCNDFDIEKVVNICEEKYKVEINFSTTKYILSNEKTSDNLLPLTGEIILFFNKNKNDFKYIESRIIDVNFNNNYYFLNHLNGLSSAIEQINRFQSKIVPEVIEGIVNTKLPAALENLANAIKDNQTLNYFNNIETNDVLELPDNKNLP